MKNFLLIILISTGLADLTQAQELLLKTLPMKDGHVYYEEVILVDSAAKQMLYDRAKRWAVDAYKSAKDVIQLDDATNGDLTIKGTFSTYWQSTFMTASDVYVDHTIHISVKDGKYRYQISDFVTHGYASPSKYSSGGPWEYSLEKWADFRPQNAKKYIQTSLAPIIDKTIISLKAAMNKPIAAKQDW